LQFFVFTNLILIAPRSARNNISTGFGLQVFCYCPTAFFSSSFVSLTAGRDSTRTDSNLKHITLLVGISDDSFMLFTCNFFTETVSRVKN
jgi:hypothetical protein